MEPAEDLDSKELLVRRTRKLIESLASMRIAEKSDIVLVCSQKEFYAHQCVLEASSEYFVAMHNSGLKESKTGKIIFKEMEPETLEIILDFLYLGQVDKIKTELQMKNVLKAAHLMQIWDLFHYCYYTLLLKLSTENFFELFEIGNKYDLVSYMTKLVKFWIAHTQELLSTVQFLTEPFNHLVDFVELLKSRRVWLDFILLGFCRWVQHDYDDRGKLAVNMVDHIDFTLVTKHGIQMLLQSQYLAKMPTDFCSKIKESSIPVLLSDDNTYVQESMLPAEIPCRTTRLIFFSSKCNEEVFYPSKNANLVARSIARCCYQQFDLVTMSWHPLCDIKPEFCTNSLCKYRQNWYMFGENKVEMYDPQTSISVDCGKIDGRKNCSIFYFKDLVYVIGGHNFIANKTLQKCPDVWCSKPAAKKWEKATSLPFAADLITVLTSEYHTYVLDDCAQNEIRIQFNSDPVKNKSWHVLYMSNEGGLSRKHFFIFENTLQALFLSNGKTVHMTYSHSEKTWKVNTFDQHPEGLEQITRICNCIVDPHVVLYVSTEDDTFCIPNFKWDPKTGQWDKLPTPSGKCEIPSACNTLVVMS